MIFLRLGDLVCFEVVIFLIVNSKKKVKKT